MPRDDVSIPLHKPADRSSPVPLGGPLPARHERSGLSLRLRIMLMLLAVFGIIQVGLSVAHLLHVRETAESLFAQEVLTTVEAITRRLQTISGPLSDADLTSVVVADAHAVLGETCAATVYDGQGNLIASTIRPPIPLDAPGGAASILATSRPLSTTRRLPGFPAEGRVPSRIVSLPYHGGASASILLVAAPETFITALTDEATTNIVLLTPVGLLLSAIAGWLIAGIAVRPLRQLEQIASQLRPDNLAQPIDFQSSASELTSLKEELEQMRRRIESGYEAQERFVANVSHEIKTPIATVLTEAQTLGRPGAPAEDVRQFIDSTQDEMRRLSRLVESFLMLTRVRHGKPLESTRKTVHVNDFVLDSIQHCWRFAEEHGVRLDAELDAEAERELLVVGDPDLLRTMVDNLIRNAVRFSPRGEHVRVIVGTLGDDQFCICVRDKGPGIAKALIDRIFDRFAQGKSEERLGRGSGLGLEIAQGIAELHGGRITVRNLDEGGCEFCATLPLADDLSASSTASLSTMPKQSAVREAGSPAV